MARAKRKTLELVAPKNATSSDVGAVFNTAPDYATTTYERETINPDLMGNTVARGVLPRKPEVFSTIVTRAQKDDDMAGFQAPLPNARGFRAGPLTAVPIYDKLPRNYGTYM
tara:strand:+ start:105 stop:440 length:336 start_codon:yes stop_codon:yes gene_type:complete